MKIKEVNWYGFDHKVINRKIPGNVTYIRSFCVRNQYHPSSVYHVANPDRSKGHKDYIMLHSETVNGELFVYIGGMNKEEMKKERYQDGVQCLSCKLVLYSINRHHCHTCGCPNETMVDGGKDYLKCGGKDMTKVKLVRINLVTGRLVKVKKHK